MTPVRSAASLLVGWAEPMPDMGPAVYRLTKEPKEHKHTYHIFCPWSPDGRLLLLLRYNRANPAAEVCVLDTATGEVRAAGRTRKWESHGAAYQQWQGGEGRILYRSADDSGPKVVTVLPDGSNERAFPVQGFIPHYCSPNGRWVYGAPPLDVMFPDDAIAQRSDKGLSRMDLETGHCELVLPVENAVALLPDSDAVSPCHLYVKTIIMHQRLGRVLFNLTNTFWDRDGAEPRIRCLISLDADGSNPAYVGRILHHPNWHSVEDRILANVKDFNDETRFGLYHGDRRGLLEYVPAATGAGHPSFSPDGRWICTDTAGPGTSSRVVFVDPAAGREIVAAEYDAVSEGYASFKVVDERAPGETVTDALSRLPKRARKTWQTQAHPAWSRDGSAVLFNADLGGGSQLFALDVNRTLAIE